MSSIQYPACCDFLPAELGPLHPYIGATAACWRRYGEVLAREYSDMERWSVHTLTVDSYAAQHPGSEEQRSAQSVTVHLASLYLVLECGVSPGYAGRAKTVLKSRFSGNFGWLRPPHSLGTVTVLDVHTTRSAQQHAEVAMKWARSVWDAWHDYHKHIKQWVHLALDDIPRKG